MFRICLAMLAFVLFQGAEPTPAQESTPAADPAAEVAKALQAYVTNFNAKDAKQLAALWSVDAVYTDRSTGDQFVGRAAMEAEFQRVFARESVPALSIETESLDFISPNVALARGTATATTPEAEPIHSVYSVVYVKRDGTWLIDRINEDEAVVDDPRHEALKELEFLIGEW